MPIGICTGPGAVHRPCEIGLELGAAVRAGFRELGGVPGFCERFKFVLPVPFKSFWTAVPFGCFWADSLQVLSLLWGVCISQNCLLMLFSMSLTGNASKILNLIVIPVPINVVNMESRRDWTLEILPGIPVEQVPCPGEVSLMGFALTVRVPVVLVSSEVN